MTLLTESQAREAGKRFAYLYCPQRTSDMAIKMYAAALMAAQREAVEACAQVADRIAEEEAGSEWNKRLGVAAEHAEVAEDVAMHIRALKEPT